MTDILTLQDIIPDRKIVKLKNLSFGGLEYENYRVEPPIWADQIETLLENGFIIFIGGDGKVFINKLISPSPDQLSQNKHFLRMLNQHVGASFRQD